MYPSSRRIPKYHIPLKSSCEYLERQSPTKFDIKLALRFDMYVLRMHPNPNHKKKVARSY